MKTGHRMPLVVLGFLTLLTALFACSSGAGDKESCQGDRESFCLAVLPDTQIYAWKFPKIFRRQTEWIAENRARYNIRYVLHVGDVVQHNIPEEWKIAREAFSLLDRKVPYAISLGNHDLGPGGRTESRQTFFSRYFPLGEFRQWPTYGGVYDREPDRMDNSYHLFNGGGVGWLVLALEFGPRDDVLRWANDIVTKYPDRLVILVTHAYLDNDGRRFEEGAENQHYPPYQYPLAGEEGDLNDGEDIWRKLVSRHANMRLVLSGHVCLSARLESTGEEGNTVHQLLVDYQTQDRGGTGWLRLLRFQPKGGIVRVKDYSPLLDRWADSPDRDFVLRVSQTVQTQTGAKTQGDAAR